MPLGLPTGRVATKDRGRTLGNAADLLDGGAGGLGMELELVHVPLLVRQHPPLLLVPAGIPAAQSPPPPFMGSRSAKVPAARSVMLRGNPVPRPPPRPPTDPTAMPPPPHTQLYGLCRTEGGGWAGGTHFLLLEDAEGFLADAGLGGPGGRFLQLLPVPQQLLGAGEGDR